jgi:phenylacetate-CoA ligase
MLDRKTVQANEHVLRSTALSGRDAIAFRTTGSTATPLTIYHDRTSLLANVAYAERDRAAEANLVGRRYGYSVLEIRASAGTLSRVRGFYAEASFRPFRPRHRLLSVDLPPEQVLAAVDELRPDVIRSYGGYLELLFRSALRSRPPRHRPRVVVYSGDSMSSAGKDLIEREFGIPVLSQYNAVEAFKIAFLCERRAGFHVHEDLCAVQVVDTDGERVATGEKGEIVISNLVNRGTMLLRYRMGDLARMIEEPCECGRTTPRLIDLNGRVDEVIDLGDGTYIYPTQLWDAFRGRPQILQYQLVQHEPSRFELKVVVADDRAAGSALQAAVVDLRRVLRGARVEVSFHPEIPHEAGGKYRHLVPLRQSLGLHT